MAFVGTLHPYQEADVDRALARGSALIAYDPGLGKEQPISEPVLTPSGWVPIGSLKVGDLVVGKNGKPTKVLGVFPQGLKNVYRVTLSDGATTRVGAEHLWEVRTHDDRARGTHRIMSTSALQAAGLWTTEKSPRRKYHIPMVEPVQFAEKELPLDPYVVGALIGDGGLGYRVVLTSADEELIDSVRERLPSGVIIKRCGGLYDYTIVATRRGQQNHVTQALKLLGLMYHKSSEKFIPREYLFGSVAQRTALLQGLLDTDGHVRPKDNNVEFCTVSLALAQDMVSLVRSLGGTTRIREHPTTHLLAYRMSISLPHSVAPFLLKRKAAVYHPRPKYLPTRSIHAVEAEGQEESVCIYVESPDHLYITNDFVVTHNTVMAIAIIEELIGEGEVETAVIVCQANGKYQWAEELAKKTDVDTRDIDVTFEDEKQTIKIPTEQYCIVIDGTPLQRKAQYAKVLATKPDYVILGYENVINDWNLVRRIKRQAIVLDEAAGIKNFRAQRTKKIKRFTAPYRFAMTATPIDNGKPEELYSVMQWVDEEVLGRFDLYDKAYIVRNQYGGVERYKNLPVLHAKLADVLSRKLRTDEDVKPYLPENAEPKVIMVRMDAKLKKAYKVMSEDLLDELRQLGPRMDNFDLFKHYYGDGEDNSEAGRVMARMTAIDQLLDHPDLVITSAMNYEDSQARKKAGEHKKTWPGSKYAYEVWQSGLLDDITSSPKLTKLVELIDETLQASPANKIIIFSQYPEMLDIIRDSVSRWGSVVYHGGMNNSAKAGAKVKFRNDPDCRLFLSSHAGGIGTDLYMANYLINYDGHWASGKQDQINGRHIRASSEFESVYTYDLLVEGTTSVLKHARTAFKRSVGSAILDNTGADEKGRVINNLPTLTEFLEHNQMLDAHTKIV